MVKLKLDWRYFTMFILGTIMLLVIGVIFHEVFIDRGMNLAEDTCEEYSEYVKTKVTIGKDGWTYVCLTKVNGDWFYAEQIKITTHNDGNVTITAEGIPY